MEAHKQQILKRDHFRCVFCGKDMIHDQESYLSITIDHLIPKTKANQAYKDLIENKVLSCRNCNALKGDYLVSDTVSDNFPEDREEYVSSVRKYVAQRRAEFLGEYLEATKLKVEQDSGGTG
jgi:5-methylcytosine-specific restriction endonuclease McrA